MKYLEFGADSSVTFNSIHTIDNIEWRPKIKLINDFDMIFTKNNKVHLLCDTESYTLNSNEVFFAWPGQSVYICPDAHPKTGVTVLHFSAQTYSKKPLNEIIEVLKENSSSPKNHIYLSKHIKLKYDYVHTILQTIFDELKYQRFGYEEKLNICLHELLYELYRSCAEDIIYGNVKYNYTATNRYTRTIMNYLHSNYMNKISEKDIKKQLNISYDYSNLVFKRITGFTIMNYLNNIRIARAKDLINTTSLNIYEIAGIVGFKDPHYFSKKFKALEGVSPSMYKTEHI